MSIVLSRIKKKITNISTIRRIINTMKIISTTKFQYCKNLKDNVSPYVDSLKEIIEKLNFMIDYKKKKSK
ncbi:F0F1 ATP synthase subunit gamma [bacterium]|nr:F0F1 ATP synthase subunit gamma [bacterium]